MSLRLYDLFADTWSRTCLAGTAFPFQPCFWVSCVLFWVYSVQIRLESLGPLCLVSYPCVLLSFAAMPAFPYFPLPLWSRYHSPGHPSRRRRQKLHRIFQLEALHGESFSIYDKSRLCSPFLDVRFVSSERHIFTTLFPSPTSLNGERHFKMCRNHTKYKFPSHIDF